MKRSISLFALIIICTSGAIAQTDSLPDPDPHRFDAEIENFIQWDRKNSYPDDALLFVGSSSIRLWLTSDYFPGYQIINRGFGGAHISDVIYFLKETVLKYQPKIIVFYAGDNDIAAGKAPERVAGDFAEFLTRVVSENEHTKVIFLAIKPSLLRWKYWPAMQKTNQLIEDYANSMANFYYVDTAAPMLGDEQKPMEKLFMSDSLHLSDEGYTIWHSLLNPVLFNLTSE